VWDGTEKGWESGAGGSEEESDCDSGIWQTHSEDVRRLC
jgi:hypothetical protein